MLTYENGTTEKIQINNLNHPIFLGIASGIYNSEVLGSANINNFALVKNSKIGKNFNLGNFSYLTNTSTGNYCTFGSRISAGSFNHPTSWLSINEFQYRDTSEIYGESLHPKGHNQLKNIGYTTLIGHDVWIGDNAVILSGVTIGNGCIIGAGSVVTKDIPDFAISAGNPAVVKKYRFNIEKIKILQKIKWWELEISELSGINFSDIDKSIENLFSKFPTRFDN